MRQATRYADRKAEQPRGMFRDALANWTNDDVLQTKAAREALGAQHPAALRVLDWPELRGLFAIYDPPRHVERMPGFPLVLAGGMQLFGERPLPIRLPFRILLRRDLRHRAPSFH